jgi:hypothetical protein
LRFNKVLNNKNIISRNLSEIIIISQGILIVLIEEEEKDKKDKDKKKQEEKSY